MKVKDLVIYDWTKWFAWRPVITEDNKIVWLETVERKIEEAIILNVLPISWTIYRRLKDK